MSELTLDLDAYKQATWAVRAAWAAEAIENREAARNRLEQSLYRVLRGEG